jgi:hypothetical protein
MTCLRLVKICNSVTPGYPEGIPSEKPGANFSTPILIQCVAHGLFVFQTIDLLAPCFNIPFYQPQDKSWG